MMKRAIEPEPIDILKMELEGDLPHWLHPVEKDADKRAKQRKQLYREKWRERQKKSFELRDWDESKHPREPAGTPEGGQFTSDGGGGDGGAEPSAAPAPDESHAASQVERIVASVPGAKEKIAAATELLARSVRTDAPVENGGYKSGGKWIASRQALHERILTKIFTPQAIAAATPKTGEKPTLHLLGGSGGSGKGWFTSPEGTINPASAIYLNGDDFKKMLPDYKGWNAGLLHDEASELVKTAEKLAREHGLNVIVDGTMSNRRSLSDRMKFYKAADYRIVGHFMAVTPETSAKRALERFVRGGREGRFVPPEYVLASTNNRENFESLRPSMDAWEIFDNEGTAPKLVEHSAPEAAPSPPPSSPPQAGDFGETRDIAEGVAERLGFPLDQIGINPGEHKFELNGKNYEAAGIAHLDTGRIELFPKALAGQYGTSIGGVTAHEIEHIKFQTTLKAYDAESKEMMADPGPAPNPDSPNWWERKGGKDAVMRPDGTLWPPYDQKYPIYQAVEKNFRMHPWDAFAEADGVSDYSFDWWKTWKARGTFQGHEVRFDQAVHETLAEMARLKYQTGKFPDHMGERIVSYRGEDKPKPSKAEMDANAKRWRDLYRTVEQVYKKMQQ